MRSENDIGAVHDFQILGRGRLVVQHVENGAGDGPVIEDTDQRLGVDEGGTAGIDKQGILLHGAQQLFIHEAAGGIADRQVERDHVAGGKKLFQRERGVMAVGAALVVIVADVTVEAVKNLRGGLAHGAEAHQTDPLALQLMAHPGKVRRRPGDPLAVFDPLDRLEAVAHVHDDQRDNELRDGLVVAARCAEDRNAGFGAGGGVEVRGSGAAVTDQLQALIAVQNLLGNTVQLGDEDVRLLLEQMLQHLVFIIPLAGVVPGLVQNLVKQLFQFGKTVLGIGGADIDFHGSTPLYDDMF